MRDLNQFALISNLSVRLDGWICPCFFTYYIQSLKMQTFLSLDIRGGVFIWRIGQSPKSILLFTPNTNRPFCRMTFFLSARIQNNEQA